MVKMIKLFSVFILIISSSFCCCITTDSNSKGNNGISALDGKQIADPIAINWSRNATLFEIRGHSPNNNGYADYWFYVYVNSSFIPRINTSAIEIKTHNKNSYSTHIFETLEHQDNLPPVGQFSIDSTEAYDIALSNEIIKRYLSKYDAKNIRLELSNSSNIPQWRIEWKIDATGNEDYKRAEIHIDANTGEVLYVKADK